MDFSIRGMETVVATVSGYHGTERFNLIKLISNSGASYVGAMSKSITHLVCWEFEGRKYELARRFKETFIVNHQWIEDCIKQGKRVSEHPYMLKCGREVGPLLMEPITEVGCLNLNRKALIEKSNILEEFERRMKGKDYGDSGLAAWTDSFLLDENLFVEVRRNNSRAYKIKPKLAAKTSKQERKSSGRYCLEDPPLSGIILLEEEDSSSNPKSSVRFVRERGKISAHEGSSTHSRRHLVKGKRKISEDFGNNSLSKPPCNGQDLLKKNLNKNLEVEILDSDNECWPIRLHDKNSNVATSSEYKDSQRKPSSSGTGTSDATLNDFDAFIGEVSNDIEEVSTRNHLPVPRESASCHEKTSTAMQRTDSCPALRNLDGNSDAGQSEQVAGLPTSMELSCVICWTEFSSTRGVLPCGHRFCYSCIQTWADRMISSGKISTCPLCKTSFASITKVEDAATSDQKIYSQTIPCASSTTNLLMLNCRETRRFGAEASLTSVCSECCCREPEDLLIMCDHCQIRSIHIYCLDPPLTPWICIHCKDLQRLYYHTR